MLTHLLEMLVTVFTWNLDQKLNVARESKQRREILMMSPCPKLWRNCLFSNLWQIWSNSETGFQTHSLENVCLHQQKLFILRKLKTELKNLSNTASTLSLWMKVLFCSKTTDFLQKNADISKIKTTLVLKDIFSQTTYVCVPTCQISSF